MLDAIERRAERVLARTFAGIHHVPGWPKRKPWGDGLKVVLPGRGLATYDFPRLTLLVIAAHDEMVRVELVPHGPAHLAAHIHPRSRREGGHVWERHPTIETMTKLARGGSDAD